MSELIFLVCIAVLWGRLLKWWNKRRLLRAEQDRLADFDRLERELAPKRRAMESADLVAYVRKHYNALPISVYMELLNHPEYYNAGSYALDAAGYFDGLPIRVVQDE